jgi:hypothetical protein
MPTIVIPELAATQDSLTLRSHRIPHRRVTFENSATTPSGPHEGFTSHRVWKLQPSVTRSLGPGALARIYRVTALVQPSQSFWNGKRFACFAGMLRGGPYQARREVVDHLGEVQAVVASSLAHRMVEQP